jgi:hypothetical protein
VRASHFDGRNVWILKPTGFNRGRGIQIFDTMDSLNTLIADYKQAYSPSKGR